MYAGLGLQRMVGLNIVVVYIGLKQTLLCLAIQTPLEFTRSPHIPLVWPFSAIGIAKEMR